VAALAAGAGAAACARVVAYPPAVVAFAVVWGAFVLAGAYPFMLGVAFALLTLGSRRLFPVFGLLTWAASPLALLLLVVVVAGLRRWRAVLVLLPLVALQAALVLVFRNPGRFPFPWPAAAAV